MALEEQDNNNGQAHPVTAGQEVEIDIDSLTSKGLGVGRYQGFVIMVGGTYPGDTARIEITDVKKKFAFGRLQLLTDPSSQRVSPFCPVASICGGCPLQVLSYPEQLRWKLNRVKRAFMKVRSLKSVSLPEVIGAKQVRGFRNKAQLPVRREDKRLVLGFFTAGTHDLVPIDGCPVQLASIDSLIKPITRILEKSGLVPYNEKKRSGELRHVLIEGSSLSDGVVVTLVTHSRDVAGLRQVALKLMSRAGVEGVVHNVQGSQTNVIVGNEFYLVSGREIIEESVSGTQFMRPSGGFFQVNSYQTGILLAEARRLAGDGKRSCIVDLFCGVGVFACFLADLADRCLGVEFSQRLVDYAKMNAGRLKLSNTGFMCADADTGMDTILKKHAPDLVVVDPPRRGLSEELISILTSSPSVKQVLYISCQPENLARDLGRLLKGGFRVGEISCVDLFPHTPHVETVVRLDR